MTDGINVEYWDSCVFLAYVKGEQHRAGEMEYVHGQASRFDAGKLHIVTSSITVAEIREASLTPEQIDKLRRIFRRPNFLFIDVSVPVSEIASKIRSYYTTHPILSGDNKPLMLQTPDAIHVASAIVAQKGAKEPLKLLTFDSEHKPKANSIGLTKLNGLVAGEFQLTIGRPDVRGFQINLAPVEPPPAPPEPEPLPIEELLKSVASSPALGAPAVRSSPAVAALPAPQPTAGDPKPSGPFQGPEVTTIGEQALGAPLPGTEDGEGPVSQVERPAAPRTAC